MMAMGKRRKQRQRQLWIEPSALAKAPGHPFYEKLTEILEANDFDAFVAERCSKFYAKTLGRPSLAPAVYFQLLLIGYFEGIGSERGIGWRVADSIALRTFLGYDLTDPTPDHSTISRTRRLIDIETHMEVFAWVLRVLAKQGLLRGKTLGVDATTLEANAAMRSIVRRDSGESYEAFLERLVKASGIETPTREDLARFDRQREKKASNKDWKHPHDPDAKITRMKKGNTHLAHKAEHAVDMETGAVVGVTLQPADRGDTTSVEQTLEETSKVLEDVIEDPVAAGELSAQVMGELVADKGYHSNAVLEAQQRSDIRTYLSEPKRGRRQWKGKQEAQRAVYGNRRRLRGARGRRLQRQRGEKVERAFAHCYETGGMRRTHLRGHPNILKRLLIHVAGFNLGLVLRQVYGFGTPRTLQGAFLWLRGLLQALLGPVRRIWRVCGPSTRDVAFASSMRIDP